MYVIHSFSKSGAERTLLFLEGNNKRTESFLCMNSLYSYICSLVCHDFPHSADEKTKVQ